MPSAQNDLVVAEVPFLAVWTFSKALGLRWGCPHQPRPLRQA